MTPKPLTKHPRSLKPPCTHQLSPPRRGDARQCARENPQESAHRGCLQAPALGSVPRSSKSGQAEIHQWWGSLCRAASNLADLI